MAVHIHIYYPGAEFRGATVAELARLRSDLMAKQSELSAAIAAVDTDLTAAITRVTTDLAALNAQVADLLSREAAGSASAEELAALEALRARINALDPTKPETLPPPVETAPATG